MITYNLLNFKPVQISYVCNVQTLNDVRRRRLSRVNTRCKENNFLLIIAAEVDWVTDCQQVHSPLLLYSQTTVVMRHQL